ncbi:MAG: hypothetical protein GF308_19670 [Candidatus Heimdallarchaeota archaeon]|nr:hypothetical protein [Candidatus Heimdallarchaeota archaeon]
MALSGDFYINLAVVVVLILLVGAFIYQTQRKNRRARNLTIGLIIAILGQAVYLVGIILNLDASGLLIIKHVRDFIFGIFYFFIFLHYEALSKERPNTLLSSLFSGFLAIFGSFTIVLMLVPENQLMIDLTRRTANFIGLGIFMYCSYLNYRTTKRVKEWESYLESIMLSLVAFAHIIYVLGDNYLLNFLNVLGGYEMLADVLATVGTFVYVLTYLINPDYLYRLPIPIYQIIIFNQSGLPCYNREVYTKGLERPEIDEMLFPAIITAISSFLSETMGKKAQLKHIDASSKQMFINTQENLSITVIADKGTRFLQKSIKILNDLIPKDLRDDLNASDTKYKPYQETLDKLVKTAFPYLKIKD